MKDERDECQKDLLPHFLKHTKECALHEWDGEKPLEDIPPMMCFLTPDNKICVQEIEMFLRAGEKGKKVLRKLVEESIKHTKAKSVLFQAPMIYSISKRDEKTGEFDERRPYERPKSERREAIMIIASHKNHDDEICFLDVERDEKTNQIQKITEVQEIDGSNFASIYFLDFFNRKAKK